MPPGIRLRLTTTSLNSTVKCAGRRVARPPGLCKRRSPQCARSDDEAESLAVRTKSPDFILGTLPKISLRFPHRAGGLLDMCVIDVEPTQPEPFALANRSPRIVIAGIKGSDWGEAHHLFINRRSLSLISKLVKVLKKIDF